MIGSRFRNRFRDAFARDGGRTLVLAHRGDSFYAPENTIAAAELGAATGAFGWEFDVQLTKDGIPVVIHDATLGRTTDVARVFPDDPRRDLGYLVSEFTLEEIRRLDAGAWFVDSAGGKRTALDFGTLERLPRDSEERYRSRRIQIPTLLEALDFTSAKDWTANVEIKSAHNGDLALAQAVIEAIRRTGVEDRVLVSSFDHDEVAFVAATLPTVATGVLTTTPLHRPVEYVKRLIGADALHVSAASLGSEGSSYRRGVGKVGLRGRMIAECRAESLPILVYTVNDSSHDGLAIRLIESGVAGFFTDDPVSMIRVLPYSKHSAHQTPNG